MSQLKVYKASAGSGKTHRLTGEYLRLLFSAPNNHRHILAVTFTNKATDEMKSRIVEKTAGSGTFCSIICHKVICPRYMVLEQC